MPTRGLRKKVDKAVYNQLCDALPAATPESDLCMRCKASLSSEDPVILIARSIVQARACPSTRCNHSHDEYQNASPEIACLRSLLLRVPSQP
eukprot:5310302-Pleurochrysis_carterae.AAC.1